MLATHIVGDARLYPARRATKHECPAPVLVLHRDQIGEIREARRKLADVQAGTRRHHVWCGFRQPDEERVRIDLLALANGNRSVRPVAQLIHEQCAAGGRA